MSTLINLKFIDSDNDNDDIEMNNNSNNNNNNKEKDEEEEEKEKEEKKEDNDDDDDEKIDNFDIDIDIEKEMQHIQDKEKIFLKQWRLYSVLDKFFIIVNFSTLLFSIFIAESSVSLALSIYTLSFSIVFDTKGNIKILEKLIILYQDEIIPEINKCVRKYYKTSNCDSYSDIIYELQHIEKENLSKYLGLYFSIPKNLRSIDWKRIFQILVLYIFSFVSLSVACYFKSKGQLQF